MECHPIKINSIDTLHRSIKHGQIEMCKLILKTNPSLVNVKNNKGETALHKACRYRKVNSVTQYLLENMADINAKNYWGQTALHYAAESMSVETMKLLLRVPGVDANCKDVNGYTVLHTFVNSSQKYDDNWVEGIQLLIDANIDMNAQTNYGQTILQLASMQDDNTIFLHHLLAKYHDLNLTLRNKSQENFLHIYGMSEVGDETVPLFKEVQKISNTVFKELLNQRDGSGLTPWCLMLDKGKLTLEHFKIITETYGVFLGTTDNLGNTALARRVGKDGAIAEKYLKLYKEMIKNGVDINSQNVFGESAGSLLYHEDVYNVLFENHLDFTTRDRWGRHPFVSVMLQKPMPQLLDTMLKSQRFAVNSRDATGSTPLHFAAYRAVDDYIELLLKHGADLEARDNLGDTPLDTARRHGNSSCWKLLAKAMNVTPSEEGVFLYKAPNVTLDFSSLFRAPIHDFLEGFPEKIETFAELALDTKYKVNTEVCDIAAAVRKHVECICEIVKGYDSRFRMSVFNTGSTAEGTKVGAPDEFDFALCIDSLNDICDIETPTDSLSYARLKFKVNPAPKKYISFSDMEGYFLALPFLHYLFRYIRRALNDRKLWEDGNLYTRSEEMIRVIDDKPVFTYWVYWNGAYYKQLLISIDLVPAVYQRGWWPSYAKFDNKKLITDEVKAAGCFVLMQTKENSFDREWHKLNDSVRFTCKAYAEVDKERLLQISVAPAEIALMKSLPEVYRRGYALAKIMKSADICPNVRIDIKPPNSEKLFKLKFQWTATWRSPDCVYPSNDIKSYWLKNCVFYIANEKAEHSPQNENPLQITLAVYQKLQEFAASWNFRPYLLEKSDLFEFVEGNCTIDAFLIRRRINIDTVLALLGQPLQNDIKNWVATCRYLPKSKK